MSWSISITNLKFSCFHKLSVFFSCSHHVIWGWWDVTMHTYCPVAPIALICSAFGKPPQIPVGQYSLRGCSPLSGSSFWTLAAWHKNLNTRVKCPLVLQLLKRVNTFSETSSLCTHTPYCQCSCQSPHSLLFLGKGLKLKMLPFHLTSVVFARHLYCLKEALLS